MPINANEFQVDLYDGSFPAADAVPLANGKFPKIMLTDGNPSIQTLCNEIQDLTALPRIREIGERLYGLLEAASITTCWDSLPKQPNDPLRTYLDLPDKTTSDLPWEFISKPDPTNGLSDPLFLAPDRLILRSHQVKQEQLCSDRILRILIITGEEYLDRPPASPAELEVANIEKVFQNGDAAVHIEVLRRPSNQNQLLETIKAIQPHVLHFIGHGGKSDAGETRALFFDAGWAWETGSIRTQLPNTGCRPRLVFINACHSGQSLKDSASIGRAFIAAGSLATISMQAAVHVRYALECTRSLYGQLAQGKSIDIALREARLGISSSDTLSNRNWGLPMLYVAMAPEKVLPFHPYPPEVRRCELRKEFMVTSGPFVNRAAERRTLLQSFSFFGHNDENKLFKGLLISGQNETGKSWFVKRSMCELFQLGFQVRYCELLGGSEEVDYRDVLSRLRNGWPGTRSPVFDPLPDMWFKEFDALNAKMTSKVLAHGKRTVSDDEIKDLFGTFIKGLCQRDKPAAAGPIGGVANEANSEAEIVLVFDRFTRERKGFPEFEFRNHLLPKLLRPILDGELPKVSCILVMRKEELEPYGIMNKQGNLEIDKLKILPIDLLKESEASRLFHEFCRYKRNRIVELLYEAWFESEIRGKGEWSPIQFNGDLLKVVRRSVSQIPG